jgi:hypothetical protein
MLLIFDQAIGLTVMRADFPTLCLSIRTQPRVGYQSVYPPYCVLLQSISVGIRNTTGHSLKFSGHLPIFGYGDHSPRGCFVAHTPRTDALLASVPALHANLTAQM